MAEGGKKLSKQFLLVFLKGYILGGWSRVNTFSGCLPRNTQAWSNPAVVQMKSTSWLGVIQNYGA
jgi:hypothetical protein